MSQELWSSVDQYLCDALAPADSVLEAALQASTDAGLPAINVAPNRGKLLNLLARSIGARRILEIGTLAGYSTIWMARALPPEGRLITLEMDARHAEVARANLARVRDGKVIDAGSSDPSVRGVRELNALLAREPRVSATSIQTVGVKGYDGLAFALVN